MTTTDWLTMVQRVQALSQTGLVYCQNDYDRERYEEIQAISLRMLATLSDVPVEQIIRLFPADGAYPTPKVDIRAVVFREPDEILMVQEKIDQNRWTVPGGWADIGYTPFEVAEKEVREETGLEVRAVRLLAVFDKRKHDHPLQPWYVYKFYVLCDVTGGQLLSETSETSGITWTRKDILPALPLSADRVTLAQLEMMFQLAADPSAPTLCD